MQPIEKYENNQYERQPHTTSLVFWEAPEGSIGFEYDDLPEVKSATIKLLSLCGIVDPLIAQQIMQVDLSSLEPVILSYDYFKQQEVKATMIFT